MPILLSEPVADSVGVALAAAPLTERRLTAPVMALTSSPCEPKAPPSVTALPWPRRSISLPLADMASAVAEGAQSPLLDCPMPRPGAARLPEGARICTTALPSVLCSSPAWLPSSNGRLPRITVLGMPEPELASWIAPEPLLRVL